MVNAFRHELLKLRRRSMILGAGDSMIAIAVLGVIVTITRAGTGRADITIATLSRPDGFASMFQQASPLIGIVALGIVAIAVAGLLHRHAALDAGPRTPPPAPARRQARR